jgi:LacI family transcriptional regulator
MKQAKTYDVYVVIPLKWAYTRRIVMGIREYSRCRPEWRLIWAPNIGWVRRVRRMRRAGIIARIRSAPLMRQIRALGVPAVNVSGRLPQSAVPRVLSDHRAVGRLAAQHLLERGFRQCLFVGDPMEHSSVVHGEGFCEVVKAAGGVCRLAALGDLRRPGALKDLPRPLGVFLYLDDIATEVMSLFGQDGWEIPRDAALVGVNDDEVFCDLAEVPLSSVDPNAEKVGYEAAALLDRLMKGGRAPAHPIRIPPRGVVTRASSDHIALADADLSKAVQFIRLHACDPMTVRDVVETIDISRRTLEGRFKALFGRTLHDEIRQVQLERARRLLGETSLSVAEVGARSGFKYVNRFSAIFKASVGKSPGAYRAAVKQVARR